MKKKFLAIRVNEDIHEKLKDISYETRRPISWIVEQGLKICIEGLEHENGGQFPKRIKNDN